MKNTSITLAQTNTADDITLPTGQPTDAYSGVKAVYELVELEYDKDLWELNLIPGARRLLTDSRHTLNFLTVPAVFRDAVKRYTKFTLGRSSSHHAENMIRHVKNFLVFYQARHPEAQDLTEMSRKDIETYLTVVRSYTDSRGRPISDLWKYLAIMYVENWIIHMQRTSDPFGPRIMVSKLIWPDDRGVHARKRARYTSRLKPKYIPDFVLRQVDAHLHEFMPMHYRPVIMLMRASGWRSSDILNLRLETCLKKTGKRWWLCGDIPKTGVEDHKVPITDEVVKIIQAQKTLVEAHYRPVDNPHGLLFPAISLERRGQGLRGQALNRCLRTFVKTHNIRDEQGVLYHFSSHAFRHTKAVELINNGMPMAVVQQWMAHASPEMTLVYAKMLSSTMLEKWEETMFRGGALRIAEDGTPTAFDPLSSDDKDEMEWEYIRHHLDAVRLPNGYCFRSEKYKDCPVQEIPCHTCVHFCTTPDFLPQFEAQREGALIQIELGKAANRPRWVERNEQLLAPIDNIITTLKSGSPHQPLGREQREYTAEERAQGEHLRKREG